jgi:hypothetical protein
LEKTDNPLQLIHQPVIRFNPKSGNARDIDKMIQEFPWKDYLNREFVVCVDHPIVKHVAEGSWGMTTTDIKQRLIPSDLADFTQNGVANKFLSNFRSQDPSTFVEESAWIPMIDEKFVASDIATDGKEHSVGTHPENLEKIPGHKTAEKIVWVHSHPNLTPVTFADVYAIENAAFKMGYPTGTPMQIAAIGKSGDTEAVFVVDFKLGDYTQAHLHPTVQEDH